MNAALTPLSAAAPAPVINSEHPWPGLASFTEESQAFFFGRKKETDELVRLIRRNTVTVLFGQSGLGKSSLLCAGAFPALRAAEFLPVRLRLDHAVSAPPLVVQVKTALMDACAAAGADARPPQPGETLWEYFHRREADIWSPENRLLTPILAFDQFEEIFTLGYASDETRARGREFLTELADLVENRIPATLRERFESGELNLTQFHSDKPLCQVVLSLREDFLPDLEGLKRTMRSVMQSRMRVCRLTGLQALEIVQKPAPHLLAEGVAEKIVEFVSDARGGSAERLAEIEVEPALLSVICRELNERRRTLGQEKITADLVSGNRREILVDFYERSVADLPEPMRLFVEDRLLTKSGFRDNLALETALELPGVTRALIDTLVLRRLLRIEERLGVQRVELTHDVLAEVIRASRDARQQRAALGLTRRRMWLARTIAAALLVLLTGASWFAWRTKLAREVDARVAAERLREETRLAEVRRAEDARIAEERRRADAQAAEQQRRAAAQLASRTDLAFGSSLLEDGRTGDALAYLVRAAQEDPQNSLLAPRLLGALANRSFFLPDRPPLPLPRGARATGRSRVTSDGKRLVFTCDDGVLRIISLVDWKIERQLRLQSRIVSASGLAIPQDNPNLFALESANGEIRVFDMATGAQKLPPVHRPGTGTPMTANGSRISLSPDGRYLTSGDRRLLYVWDTSNGKLVASVPFDRDNYFSTYQVSAGNRYVASLPNSTTIALNSPADGTEQVRIPLGENRNFVGCVFSPDGGKLVVGVSAPNAVRLYDVERKEWIGDEFKITGVRRVAFSRDSRRYVLGTEEGQTLVVDAATGKPLARPPRQNARIHDLDFSADGKLLLTSANDGVLRMWEVDTGRLLIESTLQQERMMPALFTTDGRSVLMFSGDPGAIYHLEVGRAASEPLILPRSNRTVAQVAFLETPSPRLLWMTDERGKVIDVASGAELGSFSYPQTLRSPRPEILGLPDSEIVKPGQTLFARASDDRWHAWVVGESGITGDVALPARGTMYTLGTDPDRNVVALSTLAPGERQLDLVSTVTGRVIRRIDPPEQLRALHPQFTADGKFLLYEVPISRTALRLRELDTGKEIAWRGQRAKLRPDGSRVYNSQSEAGIVIVWDPATQKSVRSVIEHRDQVVGISMANDAKFFASYSLAGSVQISDGLTGEPISPKLQHSRPVRFARFSPDGTRLLVALADGTGRVWDVRSGQPLTDILRHGTESAGGGGFSPDGRFVMLRGAVGSPARIWSLPPDGGSQPVPAWLLKLAATCAARRLNASGEIVRDVEAFTNIEGLRRELAALPDDSPYVQWGRWLLSDRATQSIAPGFTITPADSLKLREAYAAVAGVPVDEPDPDDDAPFGISDPLNE